MTLFSSTCNTYTGIARHKAAGFAAGATHPPRSGPVLPDSVPRPVPGTEDFQAATESSSDSDAEDDGPDVSALVQGSAVPETEKDELLQKIQSSSKKHQRHILSQLLSGNELIGAPAMGEDESNAATNAARQNYSLKLVDMNSTNKGSPAGGVQSFSAMVVVGTMRMRTLSPRTCQMSWCFCNVNQAWPNHLGGAVLLPCHTAAERQYPNASHHLPPPAGQAPGSAVGLAPCHTCACLPEDPEAHRQHPENPTPVWQRYWLPPQIAIQQEMALCEGITKPTKPKLLLRAASGIKGSRLFDASHSILPPVLLWLQERNI